MKIKQYIVDAFTDKVFFGNPAAICILEDKIPDDLMQKIAMENNFSETAFVTKNGNKHNLRWFTPKCEIDLCGHATLAASFVIMNCFDKTNKKVIFDTKGGILEVCYSNGIYKMDFPAYELEPVKITEEIIEAIGKKPKEIFLGRDLLCIFENEKEIYETAPDLNKVKELKGLLLHISAKGKDFDCVSRTFAPKCNVDEDSVCGSGHCHIVPYWAKKLNKDNITAYQASRRGGIIYSELNGNRVILGGKAALFSEGYIYI